MANQYESVWTSKRLARARKILEGAKSLREALGPISKEMGFKVTVPGLRAAFLRNRLPTPGSLIRKVDKVKEPGDELKQLYLLAKTPIKFSVLCDKLDKSPAKTKKLIDEAWEFGMSLRVIQDHVGIQSPIEDDRVQDVGIAPTVGERQTVAVISDTHLGSKYCLRKQLQDFVHYAYERGVRDILHPGDLLDGDYRHGKFEMSHMGIEEQTRDLFEVLPKLDGLRYHCITGNHDETFTSESGINVGRYISDYFASGGRKDVTFYGERSAFLKIRGVVVHLWHPRSAGAYALSYPLMKKIESYSVIKPQILLAGHWHRHVSCYERGVHAIACPTFQAPTSAFSKSLASAPALGGLILSWDITKHGTMRTFLLEYRSYFEVEKPIEIHNEMGGAL